MNNDVQAAEQDVKQSFAPSNTKPEEAVSKKRHALGSTSSKRKPDRDLDTVAKHRRVSKEDVAGKSKTPTPRRLFEEMEENDNGELDQDESSQEGGGEDVSPELASGDEGSDEDLFSGRFKQAEPKDAGKEKMKKDDGPAPEKEKPTSSNERPAPTDEPETEPREKDYLDSPTYDGLDDELKDLMRKVDEKLLDVLPSSVNP